MNDPTIVYEKPHQQETLERIADLHDDYVQLLQEAEEARLSLHEAVREANRVQGIKQEDIGKVLTSPDNPNGVSKSRVYAIINALDEREAEEDDDA